MTSLIHNLTMLIARRREKRVDNYRSQHDRSSETDEEFASCCGMNQSDDDRLIASGIRRVIAKLGSIEPEYINSTDTFSNDLSDLPFWDSLDTIGIIIELEDFFSIEISENDAKGMINPEFSSANYSVANAVKDWARIIKKRS